MKFSLSPGQAHDAPEGRKLLREMGSQRSQTAKVPLLMDRAYEGDKNRAHAQAMGMEPVAPPKKSRLHPWQYDKELYKKRNEVERLFRRLKGYRLSVLQIRQVGCDIYGVHRICPHLRNAPFSVNTPQSKSAIMLRFHR